LKLEHEKPLSNFAFNFNLRRYVMGACCVSAEVLYLAAGAYTRSPISST